MRLKDLWTPEAIAFAGLIVTVISIWVTWKVASRKFRRKEDEELGALKERVRKLDEQFGWLLKMYLQAGVNNTYFPRKDEPDAPSFPNNLGKTND